MAGAGCDPQFHLVTSYILSPLLLAGTRLLIAVYVLVTLIYMLIRASSSETEIDSYVSYQYFLASNAPADYSLVVFFRFFSYFTNLTYVGICAYFFASGVQSLLYALKRSKTGEEGYPLQKWPRILQYLHTLLLSTVVTYRA